MEFERDVFVTTVPFCHAHDTNLRTSQPRRHLSRQSPALPHCRTHPRTKSPAISGNLRTPAASEHRTRYPFTATCPRRPDFHCRRIWSSPGPFPSPAGRLNRSSGPSALIAATSARPFRFGPISKPPDIFPVTRIFSRPAFPHCRHPLYCICIMSSSRLHYQSRRDSRHNNNTTLFHHAF